jgi:hypothetical protein
MAQNQDAKWWEEQAGRYKKETMEIQKKYDDLVQEHNQLKKTHEEKLNDLKMTHEEIIKDLHKKYQQNNL